jgi:hypothetical protein
VIPRLAALATTAALAAVVAAPAPAAVVHLRVDSSTAPVPLFDGPVTTVAHAVDGGDGSGPHPCAGPPDGTPAATATGALDDAMRGAGIGWRGNWDPSFRDFFVDRIGPYSSSPPDRYWSLTVNDSFSAGGCLAVVESGDAVHFSYGSAFSEEAPATAPDQAGPGGPHGEGSAAGGIDPSARQLRRIARRAAHFLRRSDGEAGAGWAQLALALRQGRGPAPAAAALLGARPDELSENGSLRGDVNATALAVLALGSSRPRQAPRAADWLASVQAAGGGFGYQLGASPDIDTTGLAGWALARSGRGEEARRAADFIRSCQRPDGGFPALPGGDSNAQSTGLALAALRVAGIGPRQVRSPSGRTPLAYLAALARGDGSMAYAGGAEPTPAWTTAQALLGLTTATKLLGTGERR